MTTKPLLVLSALLAGALASTSAAPAPAAKTDWASCYMYASGGEGTSIARVVFEPFPVAAGNTPNPSGVGQEYEESGALSALLPGYKSFQTFGTMASCKAYPTFEAALAENQYRRTSQNYSIVKVTTFIPSAQLTGLKGGAAGPRSANSSSGKGSSGTSPAASNTAEKKAVIEKRKSDSAAAVMKVVNNPMSTAKNRALKDRRQKQRLAKAPKPTNLLPKEKASTLSDPATCVSKPIVGPNPACNNKGFAAKVSNNCPQPVDVRMCFHTERGQWDCRVSWGVQPGADWSQSACFADGQVFTSLRNGGVDKPLAKP